MGISWHFFSISVSSTGDLRYNRIKVEDLLVSVVTPARLSLDTPAIFLSPPRDVAWVAGFEEQYSINALPSKADFKIVAANLTSSLMMEGGQGQEGESVLDLPMAPVNISPAVSIFPARSDFLTIEQSLGSNLDLPGNEWAFSVSSRGASLQAEIGFRTSSEDVRFDRLFVPRLRVVVMVAKNTRHRLAIWHPFLRLLFCFIITRFLIFNFGLCAAGFLVVAHQNLLALKL